MRDKFTYAGNTHIALRYAMSRRGAITIDGLMGLFKHKFKKPSRARESLDILTRHGYLRHTKESWKITPAGIEYLRITARPYKGEK